jgi:hypothetical protein
MTQVTSLTKQLSDLRASKKLPRTPPSTVTSDTIPAKLIHYCWTHGYVVDHPSFKCPTPATGHDKSATKADTKNGSAINKPV